MRFYSTHFNMRLRLQPDCSSSDPLPWSGGWSWSQGYRVGRLVSFCTNVSEETTSGQGSGRRHQHNSICPCCCQLWRKGSGQGLIISLGRDGYWLWWPDTERQFCTHRTSCPHPLLTLNTFYESVAFAEKWKGGNKVVKGDVLFNVIFSPESDNVCISKRALASLCVSLTCLETSTLSRPCPLFSDSCQTVSLICLLSDPPEGKGRRGKISTKRIMTQLNVSVLCSTGCTVNSNDATSPYLQNVLKPRLQCCSCGLLAGFSKCLAL